MKGEEIKRCHDNRVKRVEKGKEAKKQRHREKNKNEITRR